MLYLIVMMPESRECGALNKPQASEPELLIPTSYNAVI